MEVFVLLIALFTFALFSGVETVFTSGRIYAYKAQDFNSNTIKMAQKYSQSPLNILIASYGLKLISIGIISWILIERIQYLYLHGYLIGWAKYTIVVLEILALVFFTIFFEFLPKNFSRLYAENFIPAFSGWFIIYFKVLHYPSMLVEKICRSFLFPFKIELSNNKIEYTSLNIERLIIEHQHLNSETDTGNVNTELFENVLFLKKTKVRECMIPRNEISAIEINEGIEQLKKTIIQTYHSRILVYEDSIDNIIGYVHHFDLHKHPYQISDILIPIKVVPETMPIPTLMNIMVKENKNIVWVVNEYGGTAGVVTLEDILEEIFGEIDDEYDNKNLIENQLSKNEFILSGRLKIDRVNEEYQLSIPEGDCETISGLLVNKMGSIPRENEIIKIENYLFKVLNVSETKIETVKLTVEDFINISQ
ncbi:MAG: hemolysin family protein [Chitinophagales bacterium]|nr:hemolysin family protein [Chitinophagales bacterium]MCZ2393871.1 hemolysin family protein [Chitinophagales bacterium]